MRPRRFRLALFMVVLGFTLAVVPGCGKKSSLNDTGISTEGFDSVGSTEELSQIPQAATAAQQSAVEVLPIETSPVTPPAGASSNAIITPAETAPGASGTALSHQEKIQTALRNAGFYNGPIDGKIGPQSRRAIEAFQEKNGLKVDGKVGPKTWAALEPYLTGQIASTSTTGT